MSERGAITTHVLDTTLGRPGSDIEVILEYLKNSDYEELERARTNDDGRIECLLKKDDLRPGTYRIRFNTKEYFERDGRDYFYPEAIICFLIKETTAHYHVPLLISSFGMSSYRGS